MLGGIQRLSGIHRRGAKRASWRRGHSRSPWEWGHFGEWESGEAGAKSEQPACQSPLRIWAYWAGPGQPKAAAPGPGMWVLLNEESQPGPVRSGARSFRGPGRGLATDLHPAHGPGCTPIALSPCVALAAPHAVPRTAGHLTLHPLPPPRCPGPGETGSLRGAGSSLSRLHCPSALTRVKVTGPSVHALSPVSRRLISSVVRAQGTGRWPALPTGKRGLVLGLLPRPNPLFPFV